MSHSEGLIHECAKCSGTQPHPTPGTIQCLPEHTPLAVLKCIHLNRGVGIVILHWTLWISTLFPPLVSRTPFPPPLGKGVYRFPGVKAPSLASFGKESLKMENRGSTDFWEAPLPPCDWSPWLGLAFIPALPLVHRDNTFLPLVRVKDCGLAEPRPNKHGV